MKKLHKDDSTDTSVEFKEGQPKSLCSNKAGSGCPSLDFPPLTDTQLKSLGAFAVILKTIHVRLIAEGFTVVDGKITPPPNYNDYENRPHKFE